MLYYYKRVLIKYISTEFIKLKYYLYILLHTSNYLINLTTYAIAP